LLPLIKHHNIERLRYGSRRT